MTANLDGPRRAPHNTYGFEARNDRPHDDVSAAHVVVGTTLAGSYDPALCGAMARAVVDQLAPREAA